MKCLASILLATLVAAVLTSYAQADPDEYGIESAAASTSSAQAGAHPDLTVSLRLKKDGKGQLPSTTRDLFFDFPPGLLANPTAIPTCTAKQLITTDVNDKTNETGCPQASQVGIVEVELASEGALENLFEPIYNMKPRYGEPARLGFIAQIYPVLVDTRLRPDDEYAATAMVEGASSLLPLVSAVNTIWGNPASESHDAQRITPYESLHNGGSPETPGGKRSANLVPVPYTLNPTRCGVPQGVKFTAIPYALPDLSVETFAPMLPNSGCGQLKFRPRLSLVPTTQQAESGAGLDAKLEFPTKGLEDPDLTAEAAQKGAEVILPEDVTVNPSQAVGLGVCSKSNFEAVTLSSGPNDGCPETSKIGSVSAISPLSNLPATGSLFIAKPLENPFGTLIALYMVLRIPERGVIVKLAGKVELDPRTGRLVTTFDGIPQLPVSDFELHFREGARSPLVTPPTCGTYQSTATFTSWADPAHPVTLHPSFTIDRGVNGGPCPTGTPPFHPGFTAGTINNNAASFSPSYLHLTREDGDQDLTKFSTVLPQGLAAKLAGVSRCPDAAIEAAKAKTGLAERAAPSCPANSEIGHVLGGAGVGSVLTYAEGKLYLAGPYGGDPLSVVAIVPAVAGPFDVGTIVTRQALRLNPDTGKGEVDGSHSDPLPHILAGIPLKVRDIRAYVDRPDFTLNPTNCDPLAFDATLWGGGNDVFSSADDSPISLSARFQAANCSLLGFKPKLSLKLSGSTHRGGFPALRAVVRPRAGDANIGKAQVTLPRSVFVEQGHFRTVCTRVQFAANQCPPGSIYGHIKAFSPLLDEPLQGPVYLRSSTHELPDLVFALHGIVDLNVVGHVDSVKGQLRSTFSSVPDAPVSKVILNMQGARKSLIVNSTDLCRATQRAKADLTGQNGKAHDFSPVVGNSCGGKGRKRGEKRSRGGSSHRG